MRRRPLRYRSPELKRVRLLYFSAPFLYNAFVLTKRVKAKIISEHKAHETDTGSAVVQVAVLSRQIEDLAAHLKRNPKDNHSRRGLLKMVSHRRKLLGYLERKRPDVYKKLIKKLGLKK